MEGKGKIKNDGKKDIVSIVGNAVIAFVCISFVFPVFFNNIKIGYQYLLVCVGLMLLSILVTILNAKKKRSAARILPFLALNDIFIYFVLFISNIISSNNIKTFSDVVDLFYFSDYLRSPLIKVIVIANIVLFVISLFLSSKSSSIFFTVLFPLSGICIVLIGMPMSPPYSRLVLSVSIIVSLVWSFICSYSSLVSQKFTKKASFYSLLFSVVMIAFNAYFFYNNIYGVNVFFKIPIQITDEIARKIYPWWLVILLMVLFIAAGAFLSFFANEEFKGDIRGYVDAKFFFSIAVLVFLSKIILSNYFSYSVILYVCVLLVLYLDLRKVVRKFEKCDKQNRQYFDDELSLSLYKLIYIVICYLFIIQIAENMLFLTLITAFIIMHMINKLINNFVYKDILQREGVSSLLMGLPKAYHFTVTALTIILTATLVYYYRFSISNFILLGTIILTILFVFIVLNRKIPKNIELQEIKLVKWCVTIFVVIVCIVTTASSGTKVKMEYNNYMRSTEISISANEKSTIREIDYKWDNSVIYNGYQSFVNDSEKKDYSLNTQQFFDDKREETLNIPVEGERLTIFITDSKGVRTKRILWYPIWFDLRY